MTDLSKHKLNDVTNQVVKRTVITIVSVAGCLLTIAIGFYILTKDNNIKDEKAVRDDLRNDYNIDRLIDQFDEGMNLDIN